MKTPLLDLYFEGCHFNVLALCLQCHAKWIGTTSPDTSLFTLECPQCGEQDSFASFLPDEYIDAIRDSQHDLEGGVA